MCLISFITAMSLTLTLSGNESSLTTDYFPPIILNSDYVCGLVDLQTYNSIPNVDVFNNLFHFSDDVIIEFPVGSYEIEDINEFVQEVLKVHNKDLINKTSIKIKANNNTLKCEIVSNVGIDFSHTNSIGSLLGFSKQILEANKKHESDLYVDINRVNTVRVECNLIDETYINNKPAHILHQFSIKVSPGYKIIEVPHNVIYLPVNTRRISTVTINLLDQDGNQINFRGENITIRIHLKPQ